MEPCQTTSLSRLRDFTGQRWRGGRGELAGREFRSYIYRPMEAATRLLNGHARRSGATRGFQNACLTDARILTVQEHKELRGPMMALARSSGP